MHQSKRSVIAQNWLSATLLVGACLLFSQGATANYRADKGEVELAGAMYCLQQSSKREWQYVFSKMIQEKLSEYLKAIQGSSDEYHERNFVSHINQISNWSPDLRKQLCDDLFRLGALDFPAPKAIDSQPQ